MRAHLLMFLGLACIAGCRTMPSDLPEPVAKVDVALVPPPAGATRMQLDSSQAFVFPQLLESPMPVYPADILALRLSPLELCVEVEIGSDGSVTDVSPRGDEGCRALEAPHAPRFAAAVGQAVRLWRYEPALVCRTPDGRAVEDACAEPDAVETPVALRLSYAFVFSQQDGKPSVELASEE